VKHIYVVESSGGKKWTPFGGTSVRAFFVQKFAKGIAKDQAKLAPGLKWRVAKYVRGEK
jgi:hypothetical protein